MTEIILYMKPVTQGSVTAIPVNGKARIIHNHSKELYEQRALIQSLYHENGGEMYDGAVTVEAEFGFVRPKSVSEKKRPHMTVKPDIDKLARAILDALTNHAYRDDSQVISLTLRKVYADKEYVKIDINSCN